jgi:hypothetical protein
LSHTQLLKGQGRQLQSCCCCCCGWHAAAMLVDQSSCDLPGSATSFKAPPRVHCYWLSNCKRQMMIYVHLVKTPQ